MKKQLLLMTLLIKMSFNLTALDRVAVVPFAAGEGVNPLIAGAVAETFSLELSKTGNFMVVSQSEVYQQIDNLGLQNVSSINDDSAVQIGNGVKTDMVYVGSVVTTDGGTTLNVSVKCIDVKTGLASYTKTGTSENQPGAVRSVCKMLAKQIAKGNFAQGTEFEKMTKDEQKMHDRLKQSMKLDWSDTEAVKGCFKTFLNAGIALAAVGSFLVILLPFCAVPFYNAITVWRVYRKVNGERLYSFLSNTSINGNWNWKEQEVCISMAIKL